jgi:hypothetical protein
VRFGFFNGGIFCTISKKAPPIHFISQPGKVYIRNNIAKVRKGRHAGGGRDEASLLSVVRGGRPLSLGPG